jgi:DNA excision repair protein ERCC-2
MESFGDPPPLEAGLALGEIYQMVIGFCAAADRGLSNYALLCKKQGKERTVRLLCLSVAEHLAEATRKLSGVVYFSATLSPLTAMQKLLGGGEEDACFALPSPFPMENLLVLRHRADTRYAFRQETSFQVASAILQAFAARPGKYIAFFPSYAYLKLVGSELLNSDPYLPLLIQENGMEEADREAFLARFSADDRPLLGLAVLGGVFAEGIDLPGKRLLGVMVVGVGLPMVCPEQEALRRHYEKDLGDGFAYAYRYPGMHKVLQAAGRVVRSETDRGVVLLIDQRYYQNDYLSLCPPHWRFEGDTLENFWNKVQ